MHRQERKPNNGSVPCWQLSGLQWQWFDSGRHNSGKLYGGYLDVGSQCAHGCERPGAWLSCVSCYPSYTWQVCVEPEQVVSHSSSHFGVLNNVPIAICNQISDAHIQPN